MHAAQNRSQVVTSTLPDATIGNAYEREVADLYNSKKDDFNLMLSRDTGLVHHHFGIGDFDRTPGAYPNEMSIQRKLHELENRQTEVLLDMMPKLAADASVFDGGSGRGGTALMVHERFGCSVIGATISSYQRDFSEALAMQRGCADKLSFRYMNMLRTGLPAGSVDVALTNETTMYVPQLNPLFAEFARIVRRGGHYVFATWAIDESAPAPREITDLIDRHYVCTMHTRAEYLKALLDNGFVPYQVRQMNQEALPYWELRQQSEHADTIEGLYLDGYRRSAVSYLMIAAQLS